MAMVNVMVEVFLEAAKKNFGDALYDKVDGALAKGVNAATGTAVGEAATAIISEAWASAANRACTTQGKDSGFDASSAAQVKQAIAFLFAEVILFVCEEAGAGEHLGVEAL